MRKILPLIALLILCWSSNSGAAIKYVDDSCGTNGNGTTQNCADGATGPFNSLQSCFTSGGANNTCELFNGTYTSTNNTGSDFDDGFTVGANGMTMKAHAGQTAITIQSNCTGSGCDGFPTITVPRRTNVTIDCRYDNNIGGIHVIGSVWVNDLNDIGTHYSNNDVIGCEVTGGGTQADGNWSGIRYDWQTGGTISHNYIHDIAVFSGGDGSSQSCIKLYSVENTVDEYNTCIDVASSDAGGVDDKEAPQNNIHRFSFFLRAGDGLRYCQQGILGTECDGSEFYGNIIVDTNNCFVLEPGPINTVFIYSNTCVNPTFEGIVMPSSYGGQYASNAIVLHDNIYHSVGDQNYLLNSPNSTLLSSNFNGFTSGANIQTGTTNSTDLTAWIAATAYDDNSTQTTGSFASATGDETGVTYTITSGPWNNSGTGGLDMGAYGAPGATGCVGWTCDDIVGGGGSTPGSPTGLHTMRSKGI